MRGIDAQRRHVGYSVRSKRPTAPASVEATEERGDMVRSSVWKLAVAVVLVTSAILAILATGATAKPSADQQ
jgi:hypothetical protein